MRGFLACCALVACHGPSAPVDSVPVSDSEIPDTDLLPARMIKVHVTLDGVAVPNAIVSQGGTQISVNTGGDGIADLWVDPLVPGADWILVAHRLARTLGTEVPSDLDTTVVFVELTSYDPIDNLLYEFQDPGEPGRRETTAQCGHCHLTINDAWFASPHRTAGKNVVTTDIYAGVAAALSEDACSGVWAEGRLPGGGTGPQCHLGVGVLPALNTECVPGDCEDPTETGGCADCHSPGINGTLGGRDHLEAQGFAFEFGVHCDVCHRVEDVTPGETPGVSGALRLHRPSEPSTSVGLGVWQPLTFGPYFDVMNPRMGAVPRDHFAGGQICSGCHQLRQEALVPGQVLDEERWPAGLPVHSTWDEFEEANPGVPCHECHMPPDESVGNAQDLGNIWADEPGPAPGWFRPPGSVRKHAWYGPRQPDSGILETALTLEVQLHRDETLLTANIDVANPGAGHAVPTGEPFRSVLLTVEAFCGETPLAAIGGDVVPEFAGFVQKKAYAEGWAVWERALPGDRIQVVEATNTYYDYPSWSELTSWTPEEKGLLQMAARGEASVLAVDDGMVTLNQVLPTGTHAYLVRGLGAARPGFAFAKVMVDSQGNQMVPHFLAVDIASDNRLMPGQSWATHHQFTGACAPSTVVARLWHRRYPTALAEERGWEPGDQLMIERTVSVP